MKEIQNLTEAATYFIKAVGGKIIRTENGSNGPIAIVLRDGQGHNAYVFFKRDWLHSYSTLFPSEEGKGFGQTFNWALMKKAAAENAFLVVVLPTGFIYGMAAAEAKEYVEAHDTIRQPSTELGWEASVPSKMLNRIEVKMEMPRPW